MLRTSYVDDCMDWPGDVVRPPFTGPLPDVPALLLGGRLDTRTPVENAFATHAQLPHSAVVTLKGSGHDTLDSDITGCIARALRRFIFGIEVGHPCAGKDNGVPVQPLPPRSLNDFKSAPGVGGARGRAVFAVLDTATDVRLTALQELFAGLAVRGGGLRGGSFAGQSAFDGRLELHRYAYVPGLRVSGTLRIDRRGRVTGTLGGRPVSYKPKRSSAAGAGALSGVPTNRDFARRRLPLLARP